MRALEPWMLDAVEAMCEGGFPRDLRGWLLASYGVGSAWEGGTMEPGDRCPNFGHDEPHVDCCSCGVAECLVPENVFFPTSNVFDIVIREYLTTAGFLPIEEQLSSEADVEDGIPF